MQFLHAVKPGNQPIRAQAGDAWAAQTSSACLCLLDLYIFIITWSPEWNMLQLFGNKMFKWKHEKVGWENLLHKLLMWHFHHPFSEKHPGQTEQFGYRLERLLSQSILLKVQPEGQAPTWNVQFFSELVA